MKKLLYASALTGALLLGACNDTTNNLSPQEIIDQAVQETPAISTYHGQYVMDIGDDQPMTVNEWVKDGKRRLEMQGGDGEHMIIVNDGEMMRMLDVKSNTVQEYSLNAEDKELIAGQSPKQQAMIMLNMVEDTHEITVAGEEQVAGRDTYHIVAKATEEGLIGDVEIWVDKENWMILKSISMNGDTELVTEYTTFDPSPKVDETRFILDIPEGAVIEEIDTDAAFEQVEIDVVKEKLGTFLVFAENDLTLEGIQDYGSADRVEYAFNYSKDGENWLTLSMFPSANATETEEEISLGEEKVTVRNIEGEQLEMGDFRYIQWTEGDVTYNVIIEHPDVTFEEAYALIEKMETVK